MKTTPDTAALDTAPDTTALPAPPPTVWPTLICRDAPAMIAFLVDVFGFTRTAVYADRDVVAHAQLDWPEGGGVMLGSLREGAGWQQQPSGAGCYVVTSQVDAIYDRVRAAGADVRTEPRDEDYGNRSFAVADPEGNLWSFGHYAGESSPSATS